MSKRNIIIVLAVAIVLVLVLVFVTRRTEEVETLPVLIEEEETMMPELPVEPVMPELPVEPVMPEFPVEMEGMMEGN